MRFVMRSLMGLFAAGLTLGLLLVAGSQIWLALRSGADGDGRNRAAQEQVFTARLLSVRPETVTPVMEAFGTVESRRRLELRAGSSGRITYLDEAVHEGGRVVAGQVLARIDQAPALAERDTQTAALEDARASLEDARLSVAIARDDLTAAEVQAELRKAAVQRQHDLAARGLGTSAERETAELAASSAEQAVLSRKSALKQAEREVLAAEITVRRTEIALREAERELEQTEVTARFDGRVTAVTAVEGGLVAENEKLGEVIDAEALEVALPLSLQQYTRLAGAEGRISGIAATVVLDGSDGRITVPAVLDRSAAAVAEGSAGRVVYAAVAEGSDRLRPGDFVTVEIDEPPLNNAARIPAAAVGADGAVLVADAEGRLSAYPVTVLRRQRDDVIVAVPADLVAAEIVAERVPQLGVGVRVRELQDAGRPMSGPPVGASAALTLTPAPERRARLIAAVQGNAQLPEAARARMLEQLQADQVPADLVNRIETRMTGQGDG